MKDSEEGNLIKGFDENENILETVDDDKNLENKKRRNKYILIINIK